MESRETNRNRGRMSTNTWMGIIFVLAGIVVILNQLDLLPVELNWWALFIFIPATATLSGAFSRYRSEGNLFSMGVLFPALTGLFMVGLAFSLLLGIDFDINWSLSWPIVLILIGLGMIFGRSRRG